MEEENNPSEALPEDTSDSDENVDVPEEGSEDTQSTEEKAEQELRGDTITLEELNKQLGRNYKSKETALKSLADTRKTAVTKEDKVAEKLKEQGYMTREEFDTEMFYGKNEEYAKNRELIDALAMKNGTTPQEVVQTDTYKDLSEKLTGYEETQNVKSVLETNPRLGQARDSMSEARQKAQEARKAFAEGDIPSGIATENEAASGAIKAVINAYDE